MLFVAEYEFGWDLLDAAIAKRLEWDEAAPEDFSFVGEYIWPAGEPPFRGVAIFTCEHLESAHQFVLHYGPTLRMRIQPATDVLSAIAAYTGEKRPAPAAERRPPASKARKGKR